MEQADVFPRRIRWLAIATGIASALALFPALLLQYSILLIAGGIIQPRFPSVGKWLVWVGAAGLSVMLVTYDVLFFPGPLPHPHYMRLTFSASTVLVVWCCVELVADGVKRMHASRSMVPVEPRPVSRGLWIFAIILSLWIGGGLLDWGWGFVHTPGAYHRLGDLYALAMSMIEAAIVIAFDISLIRRVVKLRRARGAGPPFR
jgi:hypothetical protein